MTKYKNLLFDFDGCLVSSIEFWLNIYREAFSEFNLYPSDKEIMYHVGDWDIHKYFEIEDNQRFVDIVNSKLTDTHGRQVLSPNVVELLDELSEQHCFAVVSSGVKSNILDALTNNSINHHFDVVLGVHEVINIKPDSEPILKAIDLLKGEISNSIMIGDSRKDLEAANNAGVDSILYYPAIHENSHDLEMLLTYEPTYVVKSLLEIKEIVE